MKLNNIFVTTIERSKKNRQENLNKIGNFGNKYFNINVAYSGIDGSLLQNEQLMDYINQGIIRPTQQNIPSLDEMIFMNHFVKKRYLNASEIGCFLSHFTYWNYIVTNNIECALILEDDAYFDDELLFNQIKDILSDHEKMNFNLVSLFKHNDQKSLKKYKSYNEKYNLIDARCWGTVAYIITVEGAKELLKKSVPILSPVDFVMNGIMEVNGNGYIVKNSLITLCDEFSCIRSSTNESANNISGIEFKSISLPKHIYSINNEQLKVDNYEIIHVCEDFSKLDSNDIVKLIMNGVLMPSPSCNMSLENRNEIIYSKMLKRHLSCDEISNYMSHYKIWQNIINEKIPYAIIIGKNFIFDKNKFHNEIEKISAKAPLRFTTISLEKDCGETFNIPLKEDPNFFISTNSRYTGYIISLFGAIHFVKTLSVIENTIELALKSAESEKKSGYIYKTDIIKELPTILEFKNNKREIKIKELYYLREASSNSDDIILNLKPNFFKIDEKNICVQNLINLNNGIVHPQFIKNGNIMFIEKNRPLSNKEVSAYLSHVSIWTSIVERNLESALIVDNEAKFVSSNERLQEITHNAPRRTNLLLFINDPENPLKCNDLFYHCHNNNNSKILAYIITLKGAKELLRVHKPMHSTIDNLIQTYAVYNKVGYISKETFFI